MKYLLILLMVVGCSEKKQKGVSYEPLDSPRVDVIVLDSNGAKTMNDTNFNKVVSVSGSSWKITKCPLDTISGKLYYAAEFGNNWIEEGYYIAYCGGIQVGNISGQEDAPNWIPGIFLRNDEVDEKGNLVHKEYQMQYNTGVFTDKDFKPIETSRVYGLLVYPKKENNQWRRKK